MLHEFVVQKLGPSRYLAKDFRRSPENTGSQRKGAGTMKFSIQIGERQDTQKNKQLPDDRTPGEQNHTDETSLSLSPRGNEQGLIILGIILAIAIVVLVLKG